MPREIRDIGASVRARLLDRARNERLDFQVLLTRYVLERLLYRLGISPERDRFVLKGAMLFVTWSKDPFRATRDLDLLGHGDPDAAAVAASFRRICSTPAPEDGVVFHLDGLEATAIREGADYGGVRLRTTATVAGARIPIQVDVGFGDVITPGPIEIEYPALLDAPAPRLRAYPVETVVAEKFEALVTLGIVNTRMKDFYDLWLIAQIFSFDRILLSRAVRQTFERRGTLLPDKVPAGLNEAFAVARAGQWKAFIGRERLAQVPEAFAAVIADLRTFLLPLLVAPIQKDE